MSTMSMPTSTEVQLRKIAESKGIKPAKYLKMLMDREIEAQPNVGLRVRKVKLAAALRRAASILMADVDTETLPTELLASDDTIQKLADSLIELVM